MTALTAIVIELDRTDFATILQVLAIIRALMSKTRNLLNACETLHYVLTTMLNEQGHKTLRRSLYRKASALDLETDIWDTSNETGDNNVMGKTGYLGGSLDSLILKLTTDQGKKKKKIFFFW